MAIANRNTTTESRIGAKTLTMQNEYWEGLTEAIDSKDSQSP